MQDIDPEIITGLAGAALSLLFSYTPGLKERYDQLDGMQKRLVMLALLFAITVCIAIVACAGFAGDFGINTTCDRPGIIKLAGAFLSALVANQATYLATPHTRQRISK